MAASAPRNRRSTEAVRLEMLRAAQEVFAERGYAGTTTREIAGRAQVSEPLLFRHYGTKANLFEEAVLVPLQGFISDYIDAWNAQEQHDDGTGNFARAYVQGLYDLLEANKGLMIAAITAREYETHLDSADGDGDGGSAIEAVFGRLEALTRQGWAERGRPDVDPGLGVRFGFGTVMAAALFERWLFPSKRRPSRKRVVDELTEFLLHGLGQQPKRR